MSVEQTGEGARPAQRAASPGSGQRRLSRRRALGGAGAVLGTLLGAPLVKPAAALQLPGRAADSFDVVVIGAGIAGLQAARLLADQSQRVVVLEARDRLGGRVWTDRTLAPGPTEFGASYVHGFSVRTWDWIRRLGLRTVEGSPLGTQLLLDNQLQGVVEAAIRHPDILAIASYREQIASYFGPDVSYAVWRDQQGFSPLAKTLLDIVVPRGQGATPETIGIGELAAEYRSGTGLGPNIDITIQDGYDRLIGGVAGGLDMRLSTVVERIRWADSGVEVQTSRGIFRGRRAVVTLPLGVLKAGSVVFEPSLPNGTQTALDGMVMGPAVKVALRFQQPFWDPDLTFLFTPTSAIPLFWTAPASGAVMIAFNGGPLAAQTAALGEQGAIDQALGVLTDAFGSAPRRLFAAGRLVNWIADPWSRGGYSFVRPGGVGLRRALAAPVGALHFAGEATAWNDDPATVHGALTTGQLAARQILTAFNLPLSTTS